MFFAHCLNGLFIFSLLGYKNSLYVLVTIFYQACNHKYFLPFCRLSFHFYDNILRCTKVLHFDDLFCCCDSCSYSLTSLKQCEYNINTTAVVLIIVNTNTEGGSRRRASVNFPILDQELQQTWNFSISKKYETINL